MTDKDAECPLGAGKAHGAQAFLGNDILRDKRSPSLVSSENDRECKHVYTMHGSDDVHKIRLKPAQSRTVGKTTGSQLETTGHSHCCQKSSEKDEIFCQPELSLPGAQGLEG